MFSCLPVAGGLLDQPIDLVEGIRLWRFMRHVKDLMDKEDYETIHNNAALTSMMTIIDVGEEESEAMAERFKRDEGADGVS